MPPPDKVVIRWTILMSLAGDRMNFSKQMRDESLGRREMPSWRRRRMEIWALLSEGTWALPAGIPPPRAGSITPWGLETMGSDRSLMLKHCRTRDPWECLCRAPEQLRPSHS